MKKFEVQGKTTEGLNSHHVLKAENAERARSEIQERYPDFNILCVFPHMEDSDV